MERLKISICIALLVLFPCHLFAENTRLIVTSDIGGSDPDDEESLVHLLVCLDMVDLEGFIYQHAWDSYNQGNEQKVVNNTLSAYGKVYPNLCKHSDGFPDENTLRGMVKHGQRIAGMKGIGDGKDTPGSEHIIAVVDKDDPRPVWIAAWSGMNTLAQALWKVRNTRPKDEVKAFIRKIRVYDVLGQDDAGAWIVKNFPELIYIRNKQIYGWGPSDEWISSNVQTHGELGKCYPNRIWASEGDSPSFLYTLNNGLNVPECIDWGGWGGRFSTSKIDGIRSMDWVEKNGLDETKYDPYMMYPSSSEGCDAINLWKQEIYNDFAARMIWTETSRYIMANHHPIAVVDNDKSKNVIIRNVNIGDVVTLDASHSVDTDGNNLTYNWMFYKEASTYKNAVEMNCDNSKVVIKIPAEAKGKTIHVILRVTDDGVPSLTSYRRIVLKCSMR